MADLAHVQILHFGWKRHICVELALGEQVHSFGAENVNQSEVLFRVETDVSRDQREQARIPAYALPLEVGAADAAMGKQFVATGMHAGEDGDRQPAIDRDSPLERQVELEMELAWRELLPL